MKFDPEIKQDKGRKIRVSLLGYKLGYIYIYIYIYTSISAEAFENVTMFEIRSNTKINVKVKQYHYRPGQAQKVPGG